MTNPYQPPGSDWIRPFHRRLLVASKRAIEAFRAGMKRDRMTIYELIQIVICLLIIAAFSLGIAAAIIGSIFDSLSPYLQKWL